MATTRMTSATAANLVMAFLSALFLAAVVSVFQLWSAFETATGDSPDSTIEFDVWWWGVSGSAGTIVLVVVSVLGLAGGALAGLRAAASWAGDKKFDSSWMLWYWARPLVGAGVALLLYLLIAGGLLGVANEPSGVNHYGVAALALMAGLFSKKAFEKFNALFTEMFQTAADDRSVDRITARLAALKQLLDDGVIARADHDAKAKAILDQL
jgi:hypothetical protein